MNFLKVIFLLVLFTACSKVSTDESELLRFPLNDSEELISKEGVQIDKTVSFDNSGSAKIITTGPEVIQLYETGNIDVEDAMIIYQAKVKTENVQGQVYLEMWCNLGDKGEFFSRGLDNSVAGSTDWTTIQTNFVLNKGENPINIRLNLVVAGTGTLWIDDIRLIKR